MKKILYVCRLCSAGVMADIFRTAVSKPGLSAQKFHQLLGEGLAQQPDVGVEVLSAIPITPSGHKRRLWRLPPERVEQITYQYVPIINLPIVKNLLVFIFAFIRTVLWGLGCDRKSKYVICDVLNVAVTSAALMASKLTGVTTIAIVTDLPELMPGDKKQGWYGRRMYAAVTWILMRNYDGYILLTEQMNRVVNVRSRPHVIIEGLVDKRMAASDNRLDAKAAEKIVMYSGGIYEQYGVKKLIEAFRRIKGDDLRLYIYGSGMMESDMPGYTRADPRVRYFGMVENSIVVGRQLEATLLVNPRSSIEEFTKYSFPSKNMEYMVSGTPMATAPLPGMPPEYYPFVFIFDDESVDGIERTLAGLLAKSREELHDFGQKAKEFVLACKNNQIQSARVVSLCDQLRTVVHENRQHLNSAKKNR